MTFKEELGEIRRQNFEARMKMYGEIFVLYFKCLISYPRNKELRVKLISMMRGFFVHLRNEAEIFKVLEDAYISQEEFDDFLISLDSLYDMAWSYYDGVLVDFEVAMEMGSLNRVMMQRDKVVMIDDEKKDEMLKLIWACEEINRGRDD